MVPFLVPGPSSGSFSMRDLLGCWVCWGEERGWGPGISTTVLWSGWERHSLRKG